MKRTTGQTGVGVTKPRDFFEDLAEAPKSYKTQDLWRNKGQNILIEFEPKSYPELDE